MDNTTLKQNIIDYLFKFGETCGGQCGKYVDEISTDLNLDIDITKSLIKELHTNKQIRAKSCAFGTLLFLNYDNYGK